MSQKIMINGDFFCRNLTGIERFASELCKQLDKIIDKNSISIILPANAKNVPEFNNLEIIKSDIPVTTFYKWQQITFPKYLKKYKAISLNFSNTCPFFHPDIVFIHDIYCKLYPEDFKSFRDKLVKTYSCMMYRRIAKHAKKVLTVSNFSRIQISETYKTNADDITVIPNGWNHFTSVTPDNSVFEKHSELIKGNFYFTLGSLSKRKNLKWIAEYASKHSEEHFAISGKMLSGLIPQELEILQKLQNVTLLGYVSDGEVKALMQNCKAFILPSYYEGFGIPPLEALSCGAQIIVSNAACLPEIYGDCAHYIDPNNANCNLGELLKEPVENPKSILEQYTYGNAAKMLLTELKTLNYIK